MTRLIHRSAVVLALLLSACEKKSESSHGEGNPERSTKSTRTERRESRADHESEAKVALRRALEAADKETDPAAREKALAAVAWDGIDVDRELAQRAFAGLTPGGAEARRLIAHFAMRMADDDPEAALEWARGLEQPAERDDAMGRIAVVISDSDPERAVALVSSEVPEGLVRYRTVVQIAQRWSQSAPADAGKWIATLPQGGARKAALQNLANSWLGADAPAFAAWATKQDEQLPELAAAVANSLRFTPDETVRTQRLAAITEGPFRQRVEEELKRSGPLARPQLNPPPRPPARDNTR